MIRSLLRHLRARVRKDQQGYTLVEVIASVVILGIIMVPLGTAMVVGFRTVVGIQERLAGSADVQLLSTYFPSDVASVDSDGVNPTTVEDEGVCKTSASEESLITFRWNKDLGTNGQTVVRYTARGAGIDSELVRRMCRGSDPAVETVLAKHFGDSTDAEASEYLKSEGVQTPVCDTRQCSIDIHGAFDFHLDAQRRVEGQGGTGTPPGAPTTVYALGGFERARLFWTAPANDGGSPITGYYVEMKPPGEVIGGADTPKRFEVDAGTAPGALIDGLTNNQGYQFRVRAENLHGTGPWSAPSSAITPGPTTPEPPMLDAATGDPATNGQITADWSLPSDYSDGGAALNGFRLTAINPDSTPTVVELNNGAIRTGVVTGLEDNTRYTVQVTALNSYGEGSPSASISGVLTRPGAPGAPAATGDGTAGTAVLTFAPPTAGDFTDLTNLRARIGASTLTPAVDTATACPSSASCTLTVTGINVASSTEVRVQAQNATGWGALSDPLTIAADTTPPTVAMTFPSKPAYNTAAWNAGCGGAGGAICGTATDAFPGVVANVRLTIRRSSDNRYWTGNPGTSTSQWSSSVQTLTATGTTDWTRALTTASLENTVSYTITVTARDSLDQASTPFVRTFAYVTGAPTASLTAPANGADVGGSVTVSGNAGATSPATVESAEFEYQRDGTSTWTSIEVDTSSPYSTVWDTSALADDEYDLRMRVTDSAENTTTSSVRTVDVDNTLPTGNITAPSAGATVGGASVTVSSNSADPGGSGVDDAMFQWSPVGAGTWTTIGTDSTPSGSTYSVSWNTSSLTQGNYDLRVITTDNAGNSFTSPSVTVFVNSSPTVSITFPADNGDYNSVGWPLGCSSAGICGTAADAAPGTLATVRVSIQRSSDNRYWNGSTGTGTSQWSSSVQNLTPTGTTSWFRAMTTGSLSTGVTYTVVATATDNAGLTNTDTHTFLYETTNPTGNITAPANSANVRGSVTVSSNSADSGAGVASAAFEYRVLTSGPWTAIGTDTSSPYSVAWDSSLVVDGQYYLRVVTADNAGNTFSSGDTSVRVRVDNTLPTGTLTAPADGAFVRGSSVAVSSNSADTGGSGVANATFQRSLAGADNWTNIGSPDTSSPYGVTWNTTSGAPNGSYDLRVITTDLAGNAVTSPTRTVTVDNTAPSVIGDATGTVGSNGWYLTDVELTWTVTDVGSGIATDVGCETQNVTTNTTSTGVSFTCTATDLAGNSSNGTVTIKRDDANPTGDLTGPANGALVRGTVGVFSNSADPNSGVDDAVFQRRPAGGGSWTTIGTDTSSPYSVNWNTTSGTPDGDYDLQVITTDNAGHTFTSPIRTVTVDNAEPEPTSVVLSGPGGVAGNGKAESGDQVRIVYSEPLRVSTMCTSWTGDGSDQSSSMTMTLSNNSSSDEVRFPSTCSSTNIGIVDTNRDYVSSSRNFTNSTVAWDASARTLTVTLGTPSGTTNSSQSSTAPRYRPTTNLTDIAGNTMDDDDFNGTSSRF